MRSLLIIGLFFLLPFVAKPQAQQQHLDSMYHALKTAANDTVKLFSLRKLTIYYIERNPDSALYYLEQYQPITNKLNQPLWTAVALMAKSYCLPKPENQVLAFKLNNEVIAIAKEPKNERNVFIDKGDILYTSPHTMRLNLLALGFQMLAGSYRQIGNIPKAIQYSKEVIRIGEELKVNHHLRNANMAIGSIYLESGKLDSAWFYCSKALKYSQTPGYMIFQDIILWNMGTILLKQNLLDSARNYYWRSIQVSGELNSYANEITTSISLAQLYESISQTDSMFYYANAAYKMAMNFKKGNQVASSAELISNVFKRRGNADSALAYLVISKKFADSLNKISIQQRTDVLNTNFDAQMQLEKTAQENIAYKNKIRTIGLFTGLGLLAVLAFIFYRNNLQKQKANKILETTLSNLKSTQSQLIQSEKMASLGELTAGIAHEIQNPLNFVNNFSDVNEELLIEMKDELNKGKIDDAIALANDVIENQKKINHHGKRADAIVKGMLQHSRSGTGKKELTDINALCDEYLRLAYHGLKAKDNSFSATMKTDLDESIGNINIIPQDIGRVVLNLINNAFYAVDEKKKQNLNGYEPTVLVSTKKTNGKVEIRVSDNGNGIPQKVLDKIFQPFFTTKPTGQGTGLGLSLSYDIVKAHGGEIKVNSKLKDGAEFIIYI